MTQVYNSIFRFEVRQNSQVLCFDIIPGQNGHVNVHKLQQERRSLPIFPAKHKLTQQIRSLDTAIVIGETGSGKTTQIPQV